MVEDALILRALSVAHRDGTPLVALDAQVRPGEVLSVMGPSGTGKSTLLAAINGTLVRAFVARGQVMLGARDLTLLPPQERRVGILFQDHLLFPHMSVAQNLAFGLTPGASARRSERRARVDAALAEIDLAGFGDRDPATLSGGQRARVALMRTLLAEPRALLLDEPFSRLDAALRDQMRALVFARARAARLPVLLVTHDLADAEAAGGEIVTLG